MSKVKGRSFLKEAVIEAICEVVCRSALRFVTHKNESQQILSALHRVRESLDRDRAKTSNQNFKYLYEQIEDIDKDLIRQVAEGDLGQRLMAVPGIGPIKASLLVAEVGDDKHHRCKRPIGFRPR